MIPREVLSRLSRETGERLAEVGVRPGDRAWIREHAATLQSLFHAGQPEGGVRRWISRLARKAARFAG
jgi:hypothetical protein